MEVEIFSTRAKGAESFLVVGQVAFWALPNSLMLTLRGETGKD
jgi:hypothetical protein